jgi:peptide/nickel transport system substrate-binding protein
MRKWWGVALVTAVALGASAVGGSAAVPAQKVDRNAVVRFGGPIADVGGVQFDPANSQTGRYHAMWMDLIYDTMIHRDKDGNLTPGLATKWETPDQSTVVLTLDTKRKFTDGTKFDAAAVKAAWERELAFGNTAGAGTPPEVKAITSIETPDDQTVRLRLNAPIASTLINDHLVTARWLGVPSPTAAATGTLNDKPVGAGPYMLESFTPPGQEVVLTRNPDYPDKKAQKAAGFVFTNVATGPPSINALQTGLVDMILEPPLDALETVKALPGVAVTTRPGVRVYNLTICPSKPPFTSKEARQAIQWAIDRDAINDGAFAGLATPAVVPLTPAHPFYNAKLEKTYKYDPKRAKKMLADAGVQPGTSVRLYTSALPEQRTTSEIIQAQLKDVGLDVQVTNTPNLPTEVLRDLPELIGLLSEPGLLQSAFGGNTGILNPCSWSNPAALAALNAARDGSTTAEAQQKAWDEFQRIILDESPVVFTLAAPVVVAHSDKLRGLEWVSSTQGAQLRTVYMAK